MLVVSAVHFFHFVRDITKLEGMYTLASNTNITNALLQALSLFTWNHFVSVALGNTSQEKNRFLSGIAQITSCKQAENWGDSNGQVGLTLSKDIIYENDAKWHTGHRARQSRQM